MTPTQTGYLLQSLLPTNKGTKGGTTRCVTVNTKTRRLPVSKTTPGEDTDTERGVDDQL